VVGLIEVALETRRLEELAERVLAGVASMMHASRVFLYVADSRLPASRFSQQGFLPSAVSEVERVCAEQFDQGSSDAGPEFVSASDAPGWKGGAELVWHPLHTQDRCVGLIGLGVDEDVTPGRSDAVERLFGSLARVIDRFVERSALDRQLRHLNTYLTVSSALAQPLDLHELLDIALYSCMEAVSAEAASVLLLDDEKENFHFYQVEGSAKPVLMAATFPADKGLAGSVLQRQQSEVIHDVPSDPRFYERVDSESGFHTRNMIVLPLVAGEEEVGVLEVLNKANGGSFTEEEHLCLVSLAEEIAFAIRNAKVFEYVVNTYCKQRQGQTSCRGCERPLGSWTPCVKYREADI
jgi:GAF domain-containing protein